MSTGVPASAGAPVVAFGAASAAALLSGLLGEPVEVGHACPACGSDRHGRPRVALADGRRPEVSVAHAAGLTLVAVHGDGFVGVDVEPEGAAPPPGFDALADWVWFEALAKATGEGLRRSVEARDEPGATWGVVPIEGFVAAWCVLAGPRPC